MTKPSLLQVDLGTIIVMQPKIFIHALIRSPSKSLTPRVQLCPEPATNVQQFMITNALDHVGLSYPILHVFHFSLNPGVADFCSTIRSFQRDFEDRGLPSKMSIQSHSYVARILRSNTSSRDGNCLRNNLRYLRTDIKGGSVSVDRSGPCITNSMY